MSRISVPRYLIIILSLVAGFWLLQQVFQLIYRIADILLVFGMAWLLKLLVEPLIKRLHSVHIPRGVAIAIAYLLVIGGLVGGLVWLTPQLTALVRELPALARQLAERTEEAAIWLQDRGVEVNANLIADRIIDAGTQLASLGAQRAFAYAQSFVGVVARLALVVTVAVYMSATRGYVSSALRPIVPPRFRDEYDTFVRDINQTYSSYIRGYFYIVALGTLMSALLLYGFRVPNATLWVLAVLLLRLLPFIGGTLADILLVGVFLFSMPLYSALAAIILIGLGQLLLTNMFMPRVMGRELGINPLLVLFAALLGGQIYGVAGILFSIPAAAILAAVADKAIKTFLLPLYERGGWWTDQVTVVGSRERVPAKGRAEGPTTPPGRPETREQAPVYRPESSAPATGIDSTRSGERPAATKEVR